VTRIGSTDVKQEKPGSGGPGALLFAALLFLVVLAACGSDDDGPRTTGQKVCKKIADCPETALRISFEECARQLDDDLASLPQTCATCVASVTCQGWLDFIRGLVAIESLCPTCSGGLDGG
jgi:hypothetical protein